MPTLRTPGLSDCKFVFSDDTELTDASFGGAYFQDTEIATPGSTPIQTLRD